MKTHYFLFIAKMLLLRLRDGAEDRRAGREMLRRQRRMSYFNVRPTHE